MNKKKDLMGRLMNFSDGIVVVSAPVDRIFNDGSNYTAASAAWGGFVSNGIANVSVRGIRTD